MQLATVQGLLQKSQRYFAPATLICALTLVLLLAHRSREQKIELQRVRMSLRVPHSGQVVPAAVALKANGDTLLLARQGHRQLIYFFTTTCEFCKQSVAGWKEVARRVKSDSLHDVDIVGVAIDKAGDIDAYAKQHDLTYPVAHFVSDRDRLVYGARAVPFTVLLDSTGRMAYARGTALTQPLAIDSVVAVALGRATK